MKNLVEKSIKLMGIGHPDTKTIFDIQDEKEKQNFRYKSLDAWTNRQMSLTFKYTVDSDPKEIVQTLKFQVPDKTENEIKDFVLNLIDEELKK